MTAQNITPDHVFDIATAPQRTSLHWTLGTITWGEIIQWMVKPAKTKACGNYVLGTLKPTTRTHPNSTTECTDTHRSKEAIGQRGALTLDVDHPQPDFEQKVAELEYAYILHTTFNSTTEERRYRLIVPLSRTVAPDEYHAAAGAVMQAIGVESFDPGSVQPERFMFKPAEGVKGTFWYNVYDGPVADVEGLLEDFQEDLSTLPFPSSTKRVKRDPFEIEGPVGEFNRAYDNLDTLVDAYALPYESDGTRWKLVGATAASGMGEVKPGLYYSHHANDPAFDKTCTAFDLARLHMFGDLDENAKPGTPVNRLPSTISMLEVANQDPLVLNNRYPDLKEDFSDDLVDLDDGPVEGDDDPDAAPKTIADWRIGFRTNSRTGLPTDDIENWDLIGKHDPVFKGLFYNELKLCLQTDRDLPWRTKNAKPGFDRSDEGALASYLERTYKVKASDQTIFRMLATGPRNRHVNPVVDYLNSLTWDGTPRVESCLPGVVPNDYTRMVARKVMTAAAARMLQPGIKWDHMLMIVGNEGLGKSRWIERMSKGYSSNLGKISDTSTLQAMQGNWIMTSDEGHSMRKADFDALKEFLTRTHDNFRMPYDRDYVDYPRRCVIWGTTNDPAFLKQQEGNRRFFPVVSTMQVDDDQLTDEYIDQVWAEAVVLFRSGLPLWLTREENDIAAGVREDHMEDDPLPGLIENFLNTEIPDNWGSMTKAARKMWIDQPDYADGASLVRVPVDLVCTAMILDGLGDQRNVLRPGETRPIITALEAMEGWEKIGQVQVPGYGKQTAFRRIEGFDLI